MKVHEALANGFAAEVGTTAVFGLMGDTNTHWLQSMGKRGATFYQVRHEGAGLAMGRRLGAHERHPRRLHDDRWTRLRSARHHDVGRRDRSAHAARCASAATTPWGDDQDAQRLDQRALCYRLRSRVRAN